jgi:glycolate oxidase subunit GlcD
MLRDAGYSAQRELAALIGEEGVIEGGAPGARAYLHDATESRGITGRADAVAIPATAEQIAQVVGWCYEHDVPIVPRGGGTGYGGGAVPLDGGVVLSLERLAAPAVIQEGGWRARVEAGARTADVRRRARESGLLFPPDPGAAEQSTIGGNIATNAGGPHAFKYGVTGAWVTGLDVVVAPGELVSFGGPVRKDVAGYDLKSLMIGSEGTLGIVTGGWLRLMPTPESSLPLLGLYPSIEAGCAAIRGVLEAGLLPAALEYLDAGALRGTIGALTDSIQLLPPTSPETTRFMILADADGSAEEASLLRRELRETLARGASFVHAPTSRFEIRALWRWRDGVGLNVAAQQGGKLSEDIVVPVERLAEAISATLEIGERHGVQACSWGHAGDGNVHATFMVDPSDAAELARAQAAAQELFPLAVGLGGSVSGEHGIGLVKRGALSLQWSSVAVDLHERIKATLDPKGLLNPGKKLPR